MPRSARRPTTIAVTASPAAPTMAAAMKRWSPAPMRTPSSAKATAPSGAMRAECSSRNPATATTSGSDVKIPATSPRHVARTRPPSTPTATDQRMVLVPIRRAAAASPAPRRSPTIVWAAMAAASIMRTSSIHVWNATWWAATSTSPMRAATAVPTRKVPVRERLRTRSCELTARRRTMDPGRGRSGTSWRRTSRPIQMMKQPAPAHWATTVAAADAPMPMSSPNTRTSSRTRFRTAVPTATQRGRTVSRRPRR